MMKVAHVASKTPSQPHSFLIIDALEKAAQTNALSLNFLDRHNDEHYYSYKTILDSSRKYANYLLNRGLKKGDKVVILLQTKADFVFAFYGTLLAGGIPVPVAQPFFFGSLDRYFKNLVHIFLNSEARFLFVTARMKKEIKPSFLKGSRLQHIIDTQYIGDEKPLHSGLPSIDPEDTGLIQYTSGTTGIPKGVVLSNRALMHNCHGIKVALALTSEVVEVSWLPMFHDMGLIGAFLTCMYSGGLVHIMTPESFITHPRRWLENISRYRAISSPAPNFAYQLCVNRIEEKLVSGLDLSCWKYALNGSEPVRKETMDAFCEKFASAGFSRNSVFPVYGLAENCLAAAFPYRDNSYEVESIDREKFELDGIVQEAAPSGLVEPVNCVSVGYPLAGQSISIRDSSGKVKKECQVGEVSVQGPCLMDGYYLNPDATAKTLTNGVLRTGDLGYISKGRLFITGRIKDLIIMMGRNYYPYDIERIAGSVEGLREGCVTAFSQYNSKSATESLVLVAETKHDSESFDRLKKAINAALLSTLSVRADEIVLVPPKALPKTSSGKIQRIACKKLYADNRLKETI